MNCPLYPEHTKHVQANTRPKEHDMPSDPDGMGPDRVRPIPALINPPNQHCELDWVRLDHLQCIAPNQICQGRTGSGQTGIALMHRAEPNPPRTNWIGSNRFRFDSSCQTRPTRNNGSVGATCEPETRNRIASECNEGQVHVQRRALLHLGGKSSVNWSPMKPAPL